MKKWPVLILFVILFSAAVSVYASGITNNVNISRVAVLEEEVFSSATSGRPFFIFSNITLNNHSGTVFSFFSRINIEGELGGNCVAFFSEINIKEGGKVSGFCFNPPVFVIKIAVAVLKILALLIIVSFNKTFFEQGYGACKNDTKAVLRAGLTAYFFALILGLIFFAAVITYPITILIILIMAATSLAGEVSLCMFVGSLILSSKFNLPFNSFANILAGGIIIECVSFIPYAGQFYSYFILPALCLGILIITVFNSTFYNKLYTLPYPDENKPSGNIRDIIMEGLH
ncbi:MAG: hypothetical protein LBS21_03060 [Clostridiales bacterium]|jgi:hypothetical protein|nr:hypothetical protein [Clostridiales bacterium]